MTVHTLTAAAPSRPERKSSVLFLRIASVLTLLHCFGHTIGGVLAIDAPSGTRERSVIDSMKSNRFDVMGVSRSFWDFFFGYGLIISVSFLMQSVLFWQLAGLMKVDPGRARPMVAGFFFVYLAYAILAWRFFFAPPFFGSVLIGVSLGLACLKADPFVSRSE